MENNHPLPSAPITRARAASARSSFPDAPALTPFRADNPCDSADLIKRPLTALEQRKLRQRVRSHSLHDFLNKGRIQYPLAGLGVEGGNLRPAVNIDASAPSSDSKAPFVRGHRRRSTHVTHRDLEKFRKEVLGIENRFWYEEGGAPPVENPNPSADPQLEDLNRAFASATMSLNNSGSGMAGSGPGSGMFSNYADNSANSPNLANMPRQSLPPAMPHTPAQVNGGGMAGMNGGMPMNAGHQMDLHHVYEMVLELSEVLKNNREMTSSIVNSAEEIMKRSSSEGASPNLQQVNGEISAARIAELERALAKEKRTVEILKHEQVENTKLIGEYEQAVGTMVEQIRNYCQNNNMNYLAQKRHYNNLLQAERDSHLESRLDRDYWHAQTMKCAEMIRTAYRLRCEEEEVPIRVVAGLQNEVRAYRFALGMEAEKPEEEYGWEILKDVPPSVD
ncbi:hypothetical protein ASPWEDRAFT_27873 [Aspergillus wentii DTO 134E9]|uniref:Uncharacterized protein n=1 Tax=Aspergillus wentii DTO 134E9 TaxID=1073089 RepID=A0A1L9RK36_ASPWE|nr:uncharacterized protein ASPWEDRAFT_27873 [Aspergillus wentii DTO 134E9]KAI9923809.1 hypothetical protein MW887_008291 [Aspergillus wentii]OJJ35208.1 hypothetical protein ASPWEDRAFT_27873 [Aspergillus wentii DTO 134E9]